MISTKEAYYSNNNNYAPKGYVNDYIKLVNPINFPHDKYLV